jgi:hypothetical protein
MLKEAKLYTEEHQMGILLYCFYLRIDLSSAQSN